MNPAHNLNVETWCDQKTNTWHAKLTWTETRQGKQYGGACVTEITYKSANWRRAYTRFMTKVRKQVIKDINYHWI